MKVRTRYAPSPTGQFHIGGARTALFNYLFAKHHNGKFIVRIEDTDIERNVEGGMESQLNNIDWMKITPDESPLHEGNYGPYQQTKKLKHFEELANKLLAEKKAYRCFCSKEELEAQRKLAEEKHETPKYNRKCLHLDDATIEANLKNNVPYVIRLKINENKTYEWNDIIRGKISVPGESMTDPVILKSNKIPMYNFAVVIDDYEMDISHILRGEEHISNTPYQIAIKEALKFDNKPVNYGHLSIIVNDEGKKLSKRDENLKQFIEDYRNMGFLPIAIVNFLCLLGWTPADNVEIMNLETMIRKFNIEHISKSPAKFDIDKMHWISNQHFKLLSDMQYLLFIKPFITTKNKILLEHNDDVLLLFKNQISYAQELNGLIDDLFNLDAITLDESSMNELMSQKVNIDKIAQPLKKAISACKDWSVDEIKTVIDKIKNETNLKGKDLFMPIRLLGSKKSHGPELAKTLYLFGKKEILKNIDFITDLVKK